MALGDGVMEQEMCSQFGGGLCVQALYWTVVMEKELSHKVKLLFYRSVNIPTLASGHELWVVTARTRLWIQAAEMRFLWKVEGA